MVVLPVTEGRIGRIAPIGHVPGLSRTELREMGITKPDVRASADPALSLTPAPDEDACAYLRQHGLDPNGNYICFSIRQWKDFDRYEAFSQAADYAKEKYGLEAVFMPIEQPTDVAPSRAAMAKMRAKGHLLPTPEQVPLTMAILRRMKLMCAMRLHALVFSAAANLPFIAVSYDIKVSSFMAYVDNPSCCELNEVTGDFLCRQIDRILSDPAAYRDYAARLRALEAENTRAAREMLGGLASC